MYLRSKIKYLLLNNNKIVAIIAADEKLQQLVNNNQKQLKEENDEFPFSYKELEILRKEALEKSKILQDEGNTFKWENIQGSIPPKSIIRLGNPQLNDLLLVMKNDRCWRIYSSSSATLEKYKGCQNDSKVRVILDACFVDDLINKIRNKEDDENDNL